MAEEIIDGIDGMEGMDGMEGIYGIDGIDGIDDIDGIDGIWMDGITDGTLRLLTAEVKSWKFKFDGR